MSKLPLAAQIEALLLVQAQPVPVAQLAVWLEQPEADVTAALGQVAAQLQTHGIRLAHHAGAYRLVTAPEASSALARLPQTAGRTDLSAAALETLAAIAYKGPISIQELSDLRGVTSDAMVRNLVARGLVEPVRPARPAGLPAYQVSLAFLEQFGLTSLDDLPPLTASPSASEAL